MTSTEVTGHSRTVDAHLYGVARTPLRLGHCVADPVAVTLDLVVLRRRWTVSREVLGLALDPADGAAEAPSCWVRGAPVRTDDGAAAAHVSGTRGGRWVLVVLRGDLGQWPLAVRAQDVAGFVARTYQYCSAGREQRTVDAELAAQLHLFDLTQGNQP